MVNTVAGVYLRYDDFDDPAAFTMKNLLYTSLPLFFSVFCAAY
jgi:hypothetical protein